MSTKKQVSRWLTTGKVHLRETKRSSNNYSSESRSTLTKPGQWLCGHVIRSSDITRNFTARHRGRVWMNYFVETQKGFPQTGENHFSLAFTYDCLAAERSAWQEAPLVHFGY